MSKKTKVTVEVRNPDNGQVASCDYIMEVEVAFNEFGCRTPVKNYKNGSVIITGVVKSEEVAEEIKNRFFCSDSEVKPEFGGDILVIFW